MRGATRLLALVLVAGCKQDCPPPAAPPTPVTPSSAPVGAPTPMPSPTPPVAPAPPPPPANAVQAEMRLLETALHETLTGIARGDLHAIPAAFEAVHHAKASTEEALESGHYVLPRNADQLATFHSMDEAAHAQIEKLVDAARAGDVTATSAAFSATLGACQPCHAMFRTATVPTTPPAGAAPHEHEHEHEPSGAAKAGGSAHAP